MIFDEGDLPSLHTCDWSDHSEAMVRYHDTEWGVPLRDDRKLFEFLVLDSFQAGLSWSIVLNKKEAFRDAFLNFDIASVAAFSDEKIENLTLNPGIIRNRVKIKAAVHNACIVLRLQEQFGSFSNYLWSRVNHKQIVHTWQILSEIPAVIPEAENLSRDLKNEGMKFVGPTICYAFMQSTGMVNDHLVRCFRHHECMDHL